MSQHEQAEVTEAKAEEVEYRPATTEDVPAIFEHMKAAIEEWPMFPVNFTKAFNAMYRATADGFVVLALADGRIVGSIALLAEQWWYSDEWFLRDQWNFVEPAYRRGQIGPTLIKKAKELSDRTEIPLILGVLTLNEAERKNILYRRHLTPMGEIFGHGFETIGDQT